MTPFAITDAEDNAITHCGLALYANQGISMKYFILNKMLIVLNFRAANQLKYTGVLMYAVVYS